MIVILDYGMGNPGSIKNMIRKVGGQASIEKNPETLKDASAIILPGIGSYDNGVTKLKKSGLWDALQIEVQEKKKPFLGICLGMQLLLESSEEGKLAGLGWISGHVRKFSASELKIPHMGWNDLHIQQSSHVLFQDFEAEPRFYHVHSYHADDIPVDQVLGTCTYGYEFVSLVGKENILGCQFHPEKSHRFGKKVFENFLRIIESC
ncbi:MAG: imidazole glycerol phosphate synthase subunit HisH [Pseudomonadales bacterium]|nr:imidazole glycerol phosphate synthase subunit HisH [Pseudomonadales bacterium]